MPRILMHKIHHILTISAISLLAAGCSQQDMPLPDDQYVSVPITLNVSVSQNISIGSRAEGYMSEYNTAPRRPVNFDGEQSVNDLRVYVYGSDTPDGEYIYLGGGDCLDDGAYRLNEFFNTSPWRGETMEKHTYTFMPKLKKGRYYKFLAVGRDDSSATPIPDASSVEFIAWGTKTYRTPNFTGKTMSQATLTNMLGERHYPFINTEVFTGMLTYTDAATGELKEDYVYIDRPKTGFQKELMLHRAVAGLLVYVTDIPTKAIDNSGRPSYDGSTFEPDELLLYMTTASRTLNLKPNITGETILPAETKNSVQVGFVDFNNKYGEKEDKEWYGEGSDYWRRDVIANYKGITIHANTALVGNFLLPLPIECIEEDAPTFTLQLRQKESDYISVRRVKCKIETVTDPVTGVTRPYEGDALRFPIKANCLYAIGSPEVPYSLASMSAKATSRAADDEIEMQVIEQ